MRCREEEEEEEDEADEHEVSTSGRPPEMEETKWVNAESQIQFNPAAILYWLIVVVVFFCVVAGRSR